ncbi:MAG: 16S rRNA (cytosine(1402)-N(4))-methyltransferase RsmH [Chloroflexi bacterium]|nr:16S rRNA (cytosine(1402)-N(4))-methyltransferase RsmH [Chloroflexota bacterium]
MQAEPAHTHTHTHTHTSVLLEEALEALQPRGGTGFRALDCTLGAGGHAFGLLERSSPDGQLVGLDADPAALELARARLAPFGERASFLRSNFGDLADLGLEPMNAIVFDLGLSSMQLEISGRGFSFRVDEPLDMRFDPDGDEPSAAELLNTLGEAELERILKDNGEEPRARRVAREIVRRRPLQRTGELVGAVTAALGPARGRAHPATRTFQALRIAVNDELGALERGLDGGVRLLRPGGRIAVISFHSLEDRIVKWRFRGWAEQGLARVLTRKPVRPSATEAADNPRARSAKLRVAERSP